MHLPVLTPSASAAAALSTSPSLSQSLWLAVHTAASGSIPLSAMALRSAVPAAAEGAASSMQL